MLINRRFIRIIEYGKCHCDRNTLEKSKIIDKNMEKINPVNIAVKSPQAIIINKIR